MACLIRHELLGQVESRYRLITRWQKNFFDSEFGTKYGNF